MSCHFQNNEQIKELVLRKNNLGESVTIIGEALGMYCICNSYTIGCPPVRGDNLRALASGLSNVYVDKHGISILYHKYLIPPSSVYLAHHEIFHVKVGKGGIKSTL